ncbi:uncharacterized protein LOC134290983 [Aedes albopictus]|uniref:Peptidase aspartic putative domain-containing protein n=1 Tax=Aedes albopictus TaxID=7160 RepID=A0ABM1XKC3_AEDAL
MSAAERKLRGLKNRKRSIITSVASIRTFVANYEAERDKCEVPVRLENLMELWKEFNTVQAELEMIEEDNEVLDAYLKERTEFERAYYRVKGTLVLLNQSNSPTVARNSIGSSNDNAGQTHIKLPDIKLPVFSGEYENCMECFWTIEDDAAVAYSPVEAFCEKFFRDTTVRNEDGRYVVRIPFKEDALETLGTNRQTALRRFQLIEGRLQRDPNLEAEYRKFMGEYEKLGHMKRVSETEAASEPAYFLPHHPIIREDSSTTKFRVVFDASCKSSTEVSLNDVMLVGPVVQEDLRSITMRVRLHPIMLISDVAKMYRQISLFPEDCRFHLIFWRSSPSETVQIYQLQTVTYGTASAPYLATRVLQQLAQEERDNYPLAAKATCEDFNVDDFFSGANSVANAVNLRKQMDAMFNSAGMQLRKWTSNAPETLEGVPNDNRAMQSSVDFDKDQSIKTLGLHWEPNSDQLKYVVPEVTIDPASPVTKRSALSCIAKLFDPLGLVGPVVVCAKMFMQTLWGLKDENGNQYDWDKDLPEEIKKRWIDYYTELPQLNTLRIERFVVLRDATSLELHFFSDASIAAYGSCIYIQSSNSSGDVKVSLLTSRSKDAPLKQQSFPRLELCGALLSAELYEKVSAALRFTSKAYFWVDSTTVLSWLKATPSTWSTTIPGKQSRNAWFNKKCRWQKTSRVGLRPVSVWDRDQTVPTQTSSLTQSTFISKID